MNTAGQNTSFKNKPEISKSKSETRGKALYLGIAGIDAGYKDVRASIPEIVESHFLSNRAVNEEDDCRESIIKITASAFIKFYDKFVVPFVLTFKALPFEVESLAEDIDSGVQAAIIAHHPSKGAKFTTFLYRCVQNKLKSRWEKELRSAHRQGWFITFPLATLERIITERVKEREIRLDNDINPDHPPVGPDDISEKELAIIDREYERVFSKDKPRTCYMDYTPPKDFRRTIEENDAIELLRNAIRHDGSDKRRRKRTAKLLYVLDGLVEWKRESQLAKELNKKESQIRRWIRDIESIALRLSDAA